MIESFIVDQIHKAVGKQFTKDMNHYFKLWDKLFEVGIISKEYLSTEKHSR